MKYGDEVVIASGPFKGYRGIVDSQRGADFEVKMYEPINWALTFDESELAIVPKPVNDQSK